MKIIFHASDKPREQELARAFCEGARTAGHDTAIVRLGGAEALPCDLACMVGVKSANLWHAHKRAGIRALYLDKGYSRHRGPNRTWEYWRVSLDAHHPTETTLMRRAMPTDRFAAMGLDVLPWRHHGDGPIVIAGSSAKYHDFYRLSDPTRWARKLVSALSVMTSREIVYRPKPSWKDAVPIPGSRFSPPTLNKLETLSHLLETASVLITHGSNACFDAMVAGVPSIILGNGVAKPISATALAAIGAMPRQTDAARLQLLANLAWHQYTELEFQSGEAWNTIGSWI